MKALQENSQVFIVFPPPFPWTLLTPFILEHFPPLLSLNISRHRFHQEILAQCVVIFQCPTWNVTSIKRYSSIPMSKRAARLYFRRFKPSQYVSSILVKAVKWVIQLVSFIFSCLFQGIFFWEGQKKGKQLEKGADKVDDTRNLFCNNWKLEQDDRISILIRL